ncbi:MAG: hypothetical protein WBV85_08695 [Solirubrobacteraceae bacterium]
MDFLLLSRIGRPRVLTVTLAAVVILSGCSGSSRELRTSGQSAGFVAEAASGEPLDDWNLTSNASQPAVQAWAARAKIGDLGQKLRNASHLAEEGGREEASWTCTMARKLVGLGAVGSITSFDQNDVEIVSREALGYGVKQDLISAMIHDARGIPFRDFAIATAVVCGPQVS